MSFKEVEPYIKQLKVPEIQKLLESFGEHKVGRKHELIKRLELLSIRSPHNAQELVRRVREMREHSYRAAPYNLSQRSIPPQQIPPVSSRFPQYAGPHNYGGATMGMVQNMAGSLHRSTETRTREVNDLKPLRLPFYDHVATILSFRELPGVMTGTKTQQKTSVEFQVPSEFTMQLRYDPNIKSLPREELQLRFFHLPTNYQAQLQPDDFPMNAHVKIDEQDVVLPNIIPTNKPNTEPKRLSRPVCITSYCSRKIGHISKITVSWTADRRQYAFGIFLVRRVTSEILHARLKGCSSKVQTADDTRRVISKRLKGDDDDGIAMDQLKISLLCPLTRVRMVDPVRARGCSHLQCYDLGAYLQMNEKRPTWKCPVCSGPAHYDDLIADKYFENVLSTVSKDTTEVELKEDGSFEVCTVESIDLTDSDDDEEVRTAKVNVAKPTKNGAKHTAEVIDLASDDEDIVAAVKASLESPSTASCPSIRTPPQAIRASGSEFDVITLDDTPPRERPFLKEMRPVEPKPELFATKTEVDSQQPNTSSRQIKSFPGSGSTPSSYQQQNMGNFNQQQAQGSGYLIGSQHGQLDQVQQHFMMGAQQQQQQQPDPYQRAPSSINDVLSQQYHRNAQFPEPGAAFQYMQSFGLSGFYGMGFDLHNQFQRRNPNQ